MKITSIRAQEILDSRGNPTVRVFLTAGKITVSASVPSGASTGSHEALELRDGDEKRYGGKGVLKAVRNIEKKIAPMLIGVDVRKQREIDSIMIDLDGTKNKTKLGANAILGVSLAAARCAATLSGIELWQYLQKTYRLKGGKKLPYPTMNVINGGVHADSGLSTQEFMIIPQQKKMSERVRVGSEVFMALKKILKDEKYAVGVGDEGGFAPRLGSSEKALQVLMAAIQQAGYKPGADVKLGMDVAASEFYDKGVYKFEGKKKTGAEMIEMIAGWVQKYPIVSVEDPLHEDDWEHWEKFTAKLKHTITIVGDDLFVTNVERLQQGISRRVANAILIKVNQIGSLSETIDTILLAQKNNYKVSVSHRSGETADTFIADLAVAVGADFLKSGSLSRSERVEKYNRVNEIEMQK
ncbi:MAG: enolase [Patescibacteria group bacterium]|jgi:enolase|nr:enolase [Patescibacteria group bacterium]